MSILVSSPTLHQHFIDLSTDLQRAVFCLIHHNKETAIIFLTHAQKIYDDKLNPCEYKTSIFDSDLDIIWNKVCTDGVPENEEEVLRYADKLLTVACIVFNRTIVL